MLVVDRTHPLERDLDWAPEQLRRWSPWRRDYYPVEAGAVLDTPQDDTLGRLAGIPMLDVIFFPIWLITKTAGVVSNLADAASADRTATYDDPRERNRLGALRPRAVDLVQLGEVAAGELVQVTGRIAATNTIVGVVDRQSGVGRRLAFRPTSGWWVHEALVEFAIEDDAGHHVAVDVANARILARVGAPREHVVRDFAGDHVPEAVRACFRDYLVDNAVVLAAERVLRVGQVVTLIGNRVGDDGTGGYRDAPGTLTLGASDLPLLIVPQI